MVRVRKNLFTLLLLLDPSSAPSLELLGLALQLIDQHVPLRVGLTIASDAGAGDSASANAKADANVSAAVGGAVGRLFVCAKSRHGNGAAVHFLRSLTKKKAKKLLLAAHTDEADGIAKITVKL